MVKLLWYMVSIYQLQIQKQDFKQLFCGTRNIRNLMHDIVQNMDYHADDMRY